MEVFEEQIKQIFDWDCVVGNDPALSRELVNLLTPLPTLLFYVATVWPSEASFHISTSSSNIFFSKGFFLFGLCSIGKGGRRKGQYLQVRDHQFLQGDVMLQ